MNPVTYQRNNIPSDPAEFTPGMLRWVSAWVSVGKSYPLNSLCQQICEKSNESILINPD